MYFTANHSKFTCNTLYWGAFQLVQACALHTVNGTQQLLGRIPFPAELSQNITVYPWVGFQRGHGVCSPCLWLHVRSILSLSCVSPRAEASSHACRHSETQLKTTNTCTWPFPFIAPCHRDLSHMQTPFSEPLGACAGIQIWLWRVAALYSIALQERQLHS